jgi:hypothetical protein
MTDADLPAVLPSMECARVSKRLLESWQREMENSAAATPPRPPSLLRAFSRTFGGVLFIVLVLMSLKSGVILGQTQLLAALLRFYRDDNAEEVDGYMYALGIVLCKWQCAAVDPTAYDVIAACAVMFVGRSRRGW